MPSIDLPPRFLSRMRELLAGDFPGFLAAYDLPLRRGMRANPLKMPVSRLKDLFGEAIEPAPFAPEGFFLRGERLAGADPLHHAGAYYMQEPSAMSAVTALAPRPGERVLDLCAAPGGKSTQIAAALQGQGLLFCNEYVRSRAGVLMQNLERMGVTNAAVTSMDTAPLCEALAESFDAVLCDAPCSGEGMFRKEPAAIISWSEENIAFCARRQRTILDAAARALRPGGRLLYSTCTFAPEENEETAGWFLSTHPEFSPGDLCHLPFGRPAFPIGGFPPAAGRRILPGEGGEGHFLALFLKKGDEPPRFSPYSYPKNDKNAGAAADLYRDCFKKEPVGTFVTFGDTVRLLPEGLPNTPFPVLSAGVATAAVCKGRLEPAHSIFAAMREEDCRRVLSLSTSDPRLTAFLHGEPIPCDPALAGFTAVSAEGAVVGFGKAVNGILKNRYPKGLRLL